MRCPRSKTFAPLFLVSCVVATAVGSSTASAAAGAGSPQHRHTHTKGHAAKHSRSTPLGGINLGGLVTGSNASEIDAEVAAAHRLHARVIRTEIAWSAFEQSGPGQIDPEVQAAADRLMADVGRYKMKVIALVDRTPCWASSAPTALIQGCGVGESVGGAHAWPPRQASSFAHFVAWLAKRYGSHLAAIEIWNEPDQINQAYFAGPSKPQRYAQLLRAAYPAIKHANPHVKVLAGSLVGSNGAFMNELYKAGIKGYYDGVAVHFYTLGLGSLRVFHENQVKHHDNKPLWFDEFGWSSCWPKQKIQQEQGCVTKKVQAQNLADMFKELARTKWIAAATSYNLQDGPNEDFGVLTANGKRKPAFNALAKAFQSPFGKPSPIKLKLHSKHGQVIAAGSGPVGDYMKLEAFEGGRLRYKAIFSMNRFNRFSIKLPKALGTTGLTVRVWQYWQGPKHDAQRSI